MEKMNNDEFKMNWYILLIPIVVLLLIISLWIFIEEGLWIIALISIVIILVLYIILYMFKKYKPKSKISIFIENRIEDVKEFVLNLF